MKNKIILILVTIVLFSCTAQKEVELQIPKTPISSITDQKISEIGSDDAIDWLHENKQNDTYLVDEAGLNVLGYKLLYELNKPKLALEVFELIVESFPNSSNAYDSAGEAYTVNEKYDKATAHYRKSISLSGQPQFHQLGYMESKPYAPTLLPNDTTELFVNEGNWENEVAFVYVQGGPDLQLNIGPRDGLHLMPNEGQLLKIYPYQGQMLNPELLACNPELTADQATFENAQSVEILDRVIRYLVNRNKQVFLIGHSYGASISMEYVHAKDCLADKVVIMGLDFDEDISSWDSLKSGEYIRWDGGETPYSRSVFGNISSVNPVKSSFDRFADNLTALVRSNMAKKYTQFYTDDDFQKIVSVYSTYDEANGRKPKEEKEVLTEKGTIVVEINGDHHDMLTTEFMGDLYNYLISDAPLKSNY